MNLEGLRLGGMIERHRVKAHPRVLEFYAALNKRKPSSTEQTSVVTTLADLVEMLDASEDKTVAEPSSTAGVWIEKRPLNSSGRKRPAPPSSAVSKKAGKLGAVPSFFSPTLAMSIEEEKRAEATAKASKTDVVPVATYTTNARFSSLYYDDFFEDKGYTIGVETSTDAVPSVSVASIPASNPSISSTIDHGDVAINSVNGRVVTDTKTVNNTISEEARLRIERNRLLAKEKLEQARERRRRETEEALLQVEQMNF